MWNPRRRGFDEMGTLQPGGIETEIPTLNKISRLKTGWCLAVVRLVIERIP